MSRYTRTAVVLHWLVAVVVLGQFSWGWLMQQIPKSPPGVRADAFNLHKSIGLTLLALMLLRLGWRLAHRPPAFPAMPRWQVRAATATHVALYAALIAMPLAGYLGSVWSGYPVKWFGLTLPAWGNDVPALKAAMSTVHFVTSWTLLALVTLHVAGAVQHAWRGDGIIARMSFAPRASRRADPLIRVSGEDYEAPVRARQSFPRA